MRIATASHCRNGFVPAPNKRAGVLIRWFGRLGRWIHRKPTHPGVDECSEPFEFGRPVVVEEGVAHLDRIHDPARHAARCNIHDRHARLGRRFGAKVDLRASYPDDAAAQAAEKTLRTAAESGRKNHSG